MKYLITGFNSGMLLIDVEQWNMHDLAKNIEFDLSIFLKRLVGKRSKWQYLAAEQQSITKEFAQYCRMESFADIEQGLVVRDGDRLRLAPVSGMELD